MALRASSRALRAGGLAVRSVARVAARASRPPPTAALWGAPARGRATAGGGASWTRLGLKGPSLPVRFAPDCRKQAQTRMRGFVVRLLCAYPLTCAPALRVRSRTTGAARATRPRRRWRAAAAAPAGRPARAAAAAAAVAAAAATLAAAARPSASGLRMWRSSTGAARAQLRCSASAACNRFSRFSDSASWRAATRSPSSPSPRACSTSWATSSARRARRRPGLLARLRARLSHSWRERDPCAASL
jgi:hypothetical protein